MSYDILKNLKAIRRNEKSPATGGQQTPRGTMQWFLENRQETHPIYNHNSLEFMMCGQHAFSRIAHDIEKAEKSVDIVLLGFDPGMELNRLPYPWGKRGEPYGELLNRVAYRGVKVRLLIWRNDLSRSMDENLIGFPTPPLVIPHPVVTGAELAHKAYKALTMNEVEKARHDYCTRWWKESALFSHSYRARPEIRFRDMEKSAAIQSLDKNFPGWQPAWVENILLKRFAAHHQKPILIDYDHDDPSKAIGYVMGLNSLTDYWDTTTHEFNDRQREADWKADSSGRTSRKPYRDYAIRVRGEALFSLNHNFAKAWDRAGNDKTLQNARAGIKAAHFAPAGKKGHRCQIVRTQAQEKDATIWEHYQLALSNAKRYIYVENQYFQLPEWSQGLKQIRRATLDAAKAGGLKASGVETLYVFIVTPTPERDGMVPRTYASIAELGEGERMHEYQKEVQDLSNPLSYSALRHVANPVGEIARDTLTGKFDNHAIAQSQKAIREELQKLRIEILVAMLHTYDIDGAGSHAKKEDRYREIYIHSKLMLIDDAFITLGSANLNVRSMAADSEINLAAANEAFAADARRRVWHNLGGDDLTGGSGSQVEIKQAHRNWKTRMEKNKQDRKKNGLPFENFSFILPFEDHRGSAVIVG